MTIPKLYPILDTESLLRRACDALTAARAFLDGGAEILQYRRKGHFSRGAFEEAERIAELCRAAGALFIVNDRADVAALLDAGLHVGQDDLAPADARLVLGPERVLGFSTHNAAQFEAALDEPVDYIAFGPVFGTATKENPDPVTGAAAFEALRGATDRPLVAIGGIRRSNAREVLCAGADSVAVIADLLPESCTYETVRARMEEWQQLVRG